MEKKVRVEYLFPNINNDRKYKWLENAEFSPWLQVADPEIMQFSYEEYLDRYYREDYCFTNLNNQDITEEINKESYMDWCNHEKQPRIYDLEDSMIKWDNIITRQLAIYLEKNPLMLPKFIQKHTIDIIGLFLGDYSLFTRLMAYKPQRNGNFWINHKESKNEYRHYNFSAKYKLSLFLSVLDNLLDLGVNLQEYQFSNLNKSNTYNKLDATIAWNEDIINNCGHEDYIRCDGQKITQVELLNYISFSNLSEFLDKVISLTEIEYYTSFIEEATTVDPSNILPIRHCFSSDDMSYFSKDNLVDIKMLCQKMQQKLKKVAKETEIMILKRKIMAIRDKMKEKESGNNIDDTLLALLISEIEKLYEELKKSSSVESKQAKDELDQLLKDYGLKLNNGSDDLEKPVNDSDSVSKDKKIMERLDSLEERMKNTEESINIMKNQLLEYLENGGSNPLAKLTGLSKEEQIEIISEFKPKTKGANLRKKMMLGILKLGLIGGMVTGSLFLHDNLKSNIPETPVKTMQGLQNPIPKPVIIREVRVVEKPIIIKTTDKTSEEEPLENQDKTETNSNDQVPEPKLTEEPVVSEPTEEPVVPETHYKDLTVEEAAELVIEVIRGDWGNGEVRKQLFAEAGYDYDYIQFWVNYVEYENIYVTRDNIEQLIKK